MILFTALGFASSALFSFQPGVMIGLLTGVVIANLVPARGGGCRVSYDDPGAPPREAGEQDSRKRDLGD